MSATVKSASDRHLPLAHWAVLALTLFNLFFLLGGRGLSEPDEGRNAEIAREMVERGDWLVPHLWCAPHGSGSPFTHWAGAASLSAFGINEWAARLPAALAGLSGVLAAYCLGRRLVGARAGLWAVVILQSTPLYAMMSRTLAPDIFLTQFIAWAGYFFWRSLDALKPTEASTRFLAWHLAAWVAMGLGVLSNGPIALVIPLAAGMALMIYRRNQPKPKVLLVAVGLALGLAVCAALVVPWLLRLERALPGSFAQVVSQVLDQQSDRWRGLLYFLPGLAVSFLPWTLLLGWVWRKRFWESLPMERRGGWIFLNAWAGFAMMVLVAFGGKFPGNLLPVLPPLAVLVAGRFFAQPATWPLAPWWLRRAPAISACVLMAALPAMVMLIFQASNQAWLWLQIAAALATGVALLWVSRYWNVFRCLACAAAITMAGYCAMEWKLPALETTAPGSQTLRPIGAMLKDIHRPSDALLVWRTLPAGLPFHVQPVFNAASRFHLAGLNPELPPFDFPGNRDRLAPQALTNNAQVASLVAGNARVLAVGPTGSLDELRAALPGGEVVLLLRSGRWELLSLRRKP